MEMRAAKGKTIKLILILILSAQAIFLCWLCASCARARVQSSGSILYQSPASAGSQSIVANDVVKAGGSISQSTRVGACTRADWLHDMMLALGLITDEVASEQHHAIFSTAFELGLIDSDVIYPYTTVTREYAASTIVRALGYEPRSLPFGVWDAKYGDDLMTLVYYGYFAPDEHDMIHPGYELTEDEFDSLIAELGAYRSLKGKQLLAFGDSIMFGTGNDEIGIADLIAEKYDMKTADYSVAGATFGICKGRSHIADQVMDAADEIDSADLILLDGATNDFTHTAIGELSSGLTANANAQDTFAGGMEYAMSLIRKNWPAAPVVYIRAHNMGYFNDAIERKFGEFGLRIADKWSASCVDIYSDTGFNTEDALIRDKYTYYREQLARADSVHPNALGYAVYYLPLISEAVCELI